ncbi:AMP-binding protein [Mycobacterium marseillense]|uniref:AMP-binding protein n=1 Tax=Mycobacterium marseillense TaxID=701042 RepID=UPI00259719BF|nr:AMP-binding protein [Mycobacterium marseillense]MDM3975293.1 AMP-binding protein [Mycobacterium marseillense]
MDALSRLGSEQREKPAIVVAETGDTISFGELDDRSEYLARALRSRGLGPEDGIAILLPNDPRYIEIACAATRAGLYYTPVSSRLRDDEAAYIIRDCGAKLVFVHERAVALHEQLSYQGVEVIVVNGDDSTALRHLIEEGKRCERLEPTRPGKDFFYSSGTTGLPKGVRHPIADGNSGGSAITTWTAVFDIGPSTRFLSPGPLYHAAPLRFVLATIAAGGTAVIMGKFDAEAALRAIEKYSITHSQWVPTMLFRLVDLPAPVRASVDLSSHHCAIHAAAPCPVDLKRRVIEWWGPIVWEYYSSTEACGITCISSPEWLARPGSVGKAVVGTPHILDADGAEIPVGQTGSVYFDGPTFEYFGDPLKTAQSRSPQGWSTMGDIGWLDEDGYLFLADRQAHVIISGGVNIYPAEIEQVLNAHPLVSDVAVIGVRHAEYGEEVKAIVELRGRMPGSAQMAADLMAYCRDRLAAYKCPRSVDFVESLPRLDTGKVQKHLLRSQYTTT